MPRDARQCIFFLSGNPALLQTMQEFLKNIDIQGYLFADLDDCLVQLRSGRCDLLICDIEFSRLNVTELLKHVKLTNPRVQVLVTGERDDIPTAVAAIKAGAADFITKPLDKDDLIHRISLLLCNSSVSKRLTPGELKVLKLVAEGKSSPEIARILCRSVRTVQVHRASLLRKLDVQNSIVLVQRSMEMGLIEAEHSRRKGKVKRKAGKKGKRS